MSTDYKNAIAKLIKTLAFINSVAVIDIDANIIYSTDNWEIKTDVVNLISSWSSMRAQPIIVYGVKYIIRHYTPDRLVATSTKGKGHIVGIRDNERIMIAHIEPDGVIPFATMEMARALASLNPKEPYLDETIKLGEKAKIIGDTASMKKIMRETKEEKIKRKQIELKRNKELIGVNGGISFTARLMAYYRALESKREKPLIFDPFAERLAGDITTFIKKHIRYSEMDYPIVRSYYIEENLLRTWCINQKRSQIILLGAGLDTRAYRFEPFHKDTHTIFEIDLPNLNKYKEEILQNEQPLCNLVRLSANLSKLDWISQLKKTGFSREMPTFWVLEGLAYYLEQDAVSSLLTNIADISVKDSQLFVDIMHASRWFSLPYALDGVLKDPISRNLKWGLDIKAVPSFFATVGWKVSCSFADDHDQGRNVGQKGMIFVHGIRTNTK